MSPESKNDLRTLWREDKEVFALMAAVAVVYSVLGILRHLHFQSRAWDLGNFDQMVWHYSRFEKPGCSDLGLENGLGDHFNPILALFAPLYWVWPRVEMLLAAQALLFSSALIPIFLFTERRMGRRCAYLICASFCVFWGCQNTLHDDFHPDIFAVPVIAFALYFLDLEKWAGFLASMVLLLLVKEELTLVVVFFGVYLAINKKKLFGFLVFALGAAAFYLEVMVLVPYFRGSGGGYPHWFYPGLGQQPSESLMNIMKNPSLVIEIFLSQPARIKALLFLFGSFLFLPFFSKIVVLTLPLIAANGLSSHPGLWNLDSYYSAFFCPLLTLSAADGLFNLWNHPFIKKLKMGDPVRPASLLLALNIVLAFLLSPWGDIVQPGFWKPNPAEKASALAFSYIPPDASVMTQDRIAPHLSHRRAIYTYKNIGDCNANVDFFVACRDIDAWPNSFGQVQMCLSLKEGHGYRKIFDSQGWVVLRNENYSGFH